MLVAMGLRHEEEPNPDKEGVYLFTPATPPDAFPIVLKVYLGFEKQWLTLDVAKEQIWDNVVPLEERKGSWIELIQRMEHNAEVSLSRIALQRHRQPPARGIRPLDAQRDTPRSGV